MPFRRSFLFLVGLFSLGGVVLAVYLQELLHLMPCKFCIIQRYAFLGLGVFALLASFIPRMREIWSRLCSFTAFSFTVVGLWAVYGNLIALFNKDIQCGRDLMEELLNDLWSAKEWPYLFQVTGFCGDPTPPLLGLPMPVWSLIALVVFATILFLSLFPGRRY